MGASPGCRTAVVRAPGARAGCDGGIRSGQASRLGQTQQRLRGAAGSGEVHFVLRHPIVMLRRVHQQLVDLPGPLILGGQHVGTEESPAQCR